MAMGMNMANQMSQTQNQTPAQSVDDSVESKLKKIKNLFDQGLISQEDYDKKKDEIIASL